MSAAAGGPPPLPHPLPVLVGAGQPAVSVVIGTWNRAPLLGRCIESVLAQSISDWELIVVDDGSDDDSFAVVDPYLRRDPRIRYLRQANRGAPLARNAGILASSGRHLTFLDSDDRYLPGHLASRLEILAAQPEVDLLQGGLLLEEEVLVVDYYQRDRLIDLRDCVVLPTFFARREVFLALGGFRDLSYGEDTDLWERAGAHFQRLWIREPATYAYTRAATSITRRVEAEQRAGQGAGQGAP